MSTTIQVGDNVRAFYKSGVYLGKIIEDRGHLFLVQVLAVAKHPQQGDLHSPNETEGVFFHQRKALSFNEKMNVAKPSVHLYEGEIPSYEASLQDAVNQMKDKYLAKDTPFNQKALKEIEELEKSYFK